MKFFKKLLRSFQSTRASGAFEFFKISYSAAYAAKLLYLTVRTGQRLVTNLNKLHDNFILKNIWYRFANWLITADWSRKYLSLESTWWHFPVTRPSPNWTCGKGTTTAHFHSFAKSNSPFSGECGGPLKWTIGTLLSPSLGITSRRNYISFPWKRWRLNIRSCSTDHTDSIRI